MGMFARNRMLLHLTHGEPFFRPRPCQLGLQNFSDGHVRAALGYASSAGESSDDQSSSSWFQKLKGVFKGKTTSSQTTSTAASDLREAAANTQWDLTMEEFADELKKACQFGSMTSFGRGLPRGGELLAVKSLERQEEILRALHRCDPTQVGTNQKAEVAADCGCTLNDVENVLAKYQWAKEANRCVMKLKKEGKSLPKSLNEVEVLVGRSWSAAASVNLKNDGSTSRNAPCPCGSQKKYKRCCG